MSLDIYANTGNNDVELNDSSGEWEEISPDNDKIVLSNGSDTVDDAETLPSETNLINAGLILTGSQQIVDRYFLYDLSANELKEIHLMGNENKRYVLAFDFDGATASEPVLEIWDDENLDSIDDITLGGGTPSSSYWRAKNTTDALPGANWAVDSGTTRLAGSSDGNFIYLNNENGSLVGADTLYCNLAVVIPASATQSGSFNSILAVKWLEN